MFIQPPASAPHTWQKARDSQHSAPFHGRETRWSKILSPKEPGTCSVFERVSLVSHTFSCFEKCHRWTSYICYCLFQSSIRGRENGVGGQKGRCLSCFSHRDSEGSHSHPGVFTPSASGRFIHRQGLSAQGPASTACSQQCSVTTTHGHKGQPVKGRLSPRELELWQDRIILKGPCSWQLAALSTLVREDLDTHLWPQRICHFPYLECDPSCVGWQEKHLPEEPN